MKKFVSLLLAIVLAAGALIAAPIQLPSLVVSASAEEATVPNEGETDGSEGEAVPAPESFLTYELSKDGKSYTVTGYTGGVCVVLNIPAEYNGLPVTKIGHNAFAFNHNIKNVQIPDSVVDIESYAFQDCYNLETVKLPNGITELKNFIIYRCEKLKSIEIPASVKAIRSEAFAFCSSLGEAKIPDSVEVIESGAFWATKLMNDKSLWENGGLYIDNFLILVDYDLSGTFRVKEGTKYIAQRAFDLNLKFDSIYLPASIKSLHKDAVENTLLTFLFYGGSLEQFNQIDFNNNETYLENTVVILDAKGVGKPAKPSVKSVVNVANGVQVTWNAVANADVYIVWRRGAGTSDWTLLGITNETSAIDTSAEHRKFWRYSVQAMNADGLSDFDYTGKYLKYIETPELTGISNVKNGLKFTWKAVSGATGYRVYRRGAGAKGWRYLGTVKGTSYTDTGVRNANGGYYRYTARAVVDKRYSGYEDFLYLKRLSNPTLKSAKSTGNGILVDWGSVKGSTGYYVYRKTSGSSWTRIATVKGVDNSAYTDTTAKKGVTYTYTVRAYSGKARSHYYSGIKCTR